MKVRLSERQIRQMIRESFVKMLKEEYIKGDVPDEIFQTLTFKFEKFGITSYSPYWLAASSIAWANNDFNKFVICLFNSINTGGISKITQEKNGASFSISLSAEQVVELREQVSRRIRLLNDINKPDLVTLLGKVLNDFLTVSAPPVVLSQEEIDAINSHLKNNVENLSEKLKQIFSKTLDPGQVLTNKLADAILKSKSDLSDFVGKTVLIVKPEKYEDLSQEEKAKLAATERPITDPFTGEVEAVDYPLQGDVFSSIQDTPQAEVIAVMLQNTAQPIAIVNVFKTLMKSLPEIISNNKSLYDNKHEAVWLGSYVPPQPLRAVDIFLPKQDEKTEVSFNQAFKFNQNLLSNPDFKADLYKILSASQDLSDEDLFLTTRLLKIDLRAVGYPSMIFTREGQQAAASFMCPVDSVGEAIKLSWQEENEDLGAVCGVYIADSLKFNLGLAVVQLFQTIILEILGGIIGGAIALAISDGLLIPSGISAGVLTGKIVNALLVVVENLVTQILPLVNGSMYFLAKDKKDAAAALLGRAVLQVLFTILQVGTQEFGALVKGTAGALTPAGRAAAIQTFENVFTKGAGSSGVSQLAALIAGVLIDAFLSLKLADSINPGSKEIIIETIKGYFTGVELNEESLKAMQARLAGMVQNDVLKINNLYDTYYQMTLEKQYSKKLKDLKIK